jgi:hypothetical protein
MPRQMNLPQVIADTQAQVEENPTHRLKAMTSINAATYLKLLEKCVQDGTVLSRCIETVCEECFELKEAARTLNLNSTSRRIALGLSSLLGVSPEEAVRYVFEQAAMAVFAKEVDNHRQVNSALAAS